MPVLEPQSASMIRQLKLIRQQTEQLWAALKYDVMARGYDCTKKPLGRSAKQHQ